jgi:TPR repeat protein
MANKLFLFILITVMIFPITASAAMKEYIREYVHHVGDADSKVTSRQISMEEIKVALLSELGTYISSRVDIVQGNKTDTEFKEEIVALTAGYVLVELLEERFDGETYYLKAKLSADPDDVVSRINELGKSNKESEADKAKLIKSYNDNKALRAQLANLQKQLDQAKSAGASTQSLEAQYSKEAEQLSIAALIELGNDYYWGRKGKPKDYAEAVRWYRKAAEQGNANGQSNLGVMYMKGYGVEQDYTEAVRWYRKAAEQGDVTGQNNLGVMYQNGHGLKQDYAEAVRWYRKAAEQGNANGQSNLGVMYMKGYGVEQDYTEAVRWYRKAAEQGNASGQTNLGFMFENGYGVKQDDAEAIRWYRKAAEQGDEYANEALNRLN